MIKWIKPSGIEVETNELKETVQYCESLGWKRKEENEDSRIVRRGRPPKSDKD